MPSSEYDQPQKRDECVEADCQEKQEPCGVEVTQEGSRGIVGIDKHGHGAAFPQPLEVIVVNRANERPRLTGKHKMHQQIGTASVSACDAATASKFSVLS